MRYLNWDVLLFPQDGNEVKTPLQEFKTKCDVVQDAGSDVYSHASNTTYYNTVTRGLPTVSCYVPSLPSGIPFRVSLHCWAPPEATKATLSLQSEDDVVVFEAKVLVDGDTAAGLVFGADAHWPQIIDTTGPSKDGKPSLLGFPAFHPEMLSQTWVLPHESTGRIKIVIAEGVSHGPPGSTPFERRRNLVAFSFLHTPLHILEDSGIAWPNPGMFYQMSYPGFNPLSPPNTKNAEPDAHAHAHSPRRGAPAVPVGASATVAPQRISIGMAHPEIGMPPPPFIAHPHQAGDPFLSQYHYHDSFSGAGESFMRGNIFQGGKRHISSSGDVSMHDVQSRSTISDEVMADYLRATSPTSRSSSYSLNRLPKAFSPDGYHILPQLAPSIVRSLSPPQDRQVSAESLRGPRMQRLFEEIEIQSGREAQPPEQSQFTEMINAMSPRTVSEIPQYSSANDKANSAASTSTVTTRVSAAAEARASSYKGKDRSSSQNSFDLPRTNQLQTSPKGVSRPRNGLCMSDSHQSGVVCQEKHDLQKVIKTSASPQVKSRKENRINEISQRDANESRGADSLEPELAQNEEKAEPPHHSGSTHKRRRTASNVGPAELLGTQETNSKLVPEESFDINFQAELPEKLNKTGGLSPDDIVTRAPLGNLSNKS